MHRVGVLAGRDDDVAGLVLPHRAGQGELAQAGALEAVEEGELFEDVEHGPSLPWPRAAHSPAHWRPVVRASVQIGTARFGPWTL